MGFLLKPLMTVTSMCEVSGGALYLRPCCSGFPSSSWARARTGENDANKTSVVTTERTEARLGRTRNNIRLVYASPDRARNRLPFLYFRHSANELIRSLQVL